MNEIKDEEEKEELEIMEELKKRQVIEELGKRQTKEEIKKKIKEVLYKEYKKSYDYYMKGNMKEYKEEQKKIDKIAWEGVNLGMSNEEITKIAYRVYKENQKKS